jgi:hypothetical protein
LPRLPSADWGIRLGAGERVHESTGRVVPLAKHLHGHASDSKAPRPIWIWIWRDVGVRVVGELKDQIATGIARERQLRQRQNKVAASSVYLLKGLQPQVVAMLLYPYSVNFQRGLCRGVSDREKKGQY